MRSSTSLGLGHRPTGAGCILPPYLLDRLAGSDDPVLARAGEHTRAVQATLRGRRETRATRHPGEDRPAPATPRGFVPESLRRRAHPRAPDAGRADTRQDAAKEARPARSVYDAEHRSVLPGVLRRAEGAVPHPDESVNESYDGLGATWRLLFEVYGRNSLDDRGLPLIASVHFERNYDNAFWDGEQMVFGDGDGVIFRSFTDAPDVIGHELAHGLTQYTAGFVYVGQSGALNESISDVIGVLTVQHARRQRADEADWLVGAGLFTDAVRGVALRSMLEPGTAYDDPTLGKDPQPGRMSDYVRLPHDEQHDNGGVHINSGIPNRAFALTALAIGGHAWERAGRIWYDTLTVGGLPKDADFARFAAATLAVSQDRYGPGSTEHDAVRAAWAQVEVTPAVSETGHPPLHPASRAAARSAGHPRGDSTTAPGPRTP